jgi:hypothetical protein
MQTATLPPVAPEVPAVSLDPFGLDVLPADLDWPPQDPAELARLEEWIDRMEREHAERFGNSCDQE